MAVCLPACLTACVPACLQGEVNVPIGRIDYPGVRGGLFAARPDGGPGAKPSRSRYTVVRRDPAAGTTLVDVEIFTGGHSAVPLAGKQRVQALGSTNINAAPASLSCLLKGHRPHPRPPAICHAQAGRTRSGYTWRRRGTRWRETLSMRPAACPGRLEQRQAVVRQLGTDVWRQRRGSGSQSLPLQGAMTSKLRRRRHVGSRPRSQQRKEVTSSGWHRQ